VFRGTHVDLDTVSTRRATTITVECPGISAYADGDFACTLPADISVPGKR
jgi:diacylglycerol kinase (ATP)